MDMSRADQSPEVAFVTAWAPEPEVVVDIAAVEADSASDDGNAEVIAYLAVLHAEILAMKNELEALRRETSST